MENSRTTPSVSLPRTHLRDSRRVTCEGEPLLRGDISDPAEDSVLEIPLPLTETRRNQTVEVLHVDDNPEFVELSATFLEGLTEDITVVSETTVVSALERLKERDFDCVVSDYQMPATDGLEFLEIVREQYPDIPFILFTGKGSEEIASEAIASGVTDYMQKGSGSDTYEVLANRISNAVDRYRTQQQFWTALSWYQRLVEQELAGVAILQDFEFVYVNQKLADMFGGDQQALIGESPLSLVAESDHHILVESLIQRSEAADETFQHEFTAERADGSTFPAEFHGGAITFEGNDAWIAIFRDRSKTA